MKNLIVGNSQAVLPIIENIFKENQTAQITLFTTEGVLPYDRSLLPALVAGSIKDSSTHQGIEKFLKDHHVEVYSKEKLLRISVKRKHLTTEKKTQINYDRMFLVDTGELILPMIKGHQRQGVFDCLRMSSIKAMMKFVPFVDHIAVVVNSLQGLNMACALTQFKKEVFIISRGPGFLSEIFDEETGNLLKQILEGQGLRVFVDNNIEEILGDVDVKAVKLKSKKIIACEAVILDEAKVDIRMLSEPDLTENDQICIEDCFKPITLPILPTELGQNVFNGFCAGWTMLPEGGREYLKFDGPENVFKKVYILDDTIVGFVLLNAPQDKDRLWDLFVNKTNIAGMEENLL